jgi:predicted DNA-binding antitoxin AbrB/MazE fold protein
MTPAITVRAVYIGGVLRPEQPLPLADGEVIDVTIGKSAGISVPIRAATSEELEYARRIQAAQSLDAMHALMETAPESPDDDVDIVAAINESRRLTGFRMPDPALAKETPR